jgi:hypothetical protein
MGRDAAALWSSMTLGQRLLAALIALAMLCALSAILWVVAPH